MRLPVAALTRFAEAVLAAIGTPPAVAAEVAAHLVEADLRGVGSHGVMRLGRAARQFGVDASALVPPGTA